MSSSAFTYCREDRFWVDLVSFIVLRELKLIPGVADQLALRGSLLTRSLLHELEPNHGLERSRPPNDIDLLFITHEQIISSSSEARRFPRGLLQPSPGHNKLFNDLISRIVKHFTGQNFSSDHCFVDADGQDIVASLTVRDRIVQIENTFVGEAFPSVKISFNTRVKFSSGSYNDNKVIPFAFDISSGDPIFGAPLMTDICFEHVPNPLVSFPAVDINNLVAFKLHSSIQNGTWRPKDVFDLSILLPWIEDFNKLKAATHLAFASRDGHVSELKRLITADLGPNKYPDWSAFTEQEPLAQGHKLNDLCLEIGKYLRLHLR